MGAALYKSAPIFRAALDRCAAILAPRLERPLLDVIFAEGDDAIHQTGYTQPALFAVEYALSELWRSWGIVPFAVLGHSVGEYVAAVVAGVMSLEDGLLLIAERGRLMQSLPAGGAMAAIFAPQDAVREALQSEPALSVAAINGPAHTVISGAEEAVARVSTTFANTGVRVQSLTVSHAFHSPLMEPILDSFGQAVASVNLRPARIPLVSNAAGAAAGAEIAEAAYWQKHIREAVHFSAGVETLAHMGADVFLEIGPQPVLLGMARAIHSGSDAPAALPSLRKGQDEWAQMLASLGQLYTRGASIRWDVVAPAAEGRKIVLPTSPFQRRRFWADIGSATSQRIGAPRSNEGHPLLGKRLRSPLLRESIFESVIGAQQPPWLADHRIQGQVVFPGSAYVEMALAAASSFAIAGASTDLSFRSMLTLTGDARSTLQLALTPDSDATATLKIVSSPADAETAAGWTAAAEYTLHAEGALHKGAELQPEPLPLADVQERLAGGAMDTDSYYADMAEHGLDYGPAFQGLAQLYAGDGEALGSVELPAPFAAQAGDYQFHPALLDACFHVIGAALHPPATNGATQHFYVPIELHGVRVYQPGSTRVWCHARVLTTQGDSETGAAGNGAGNGAGSAEGTGNAEILSAALLIVDDAGSPVASIDRLDLRLMQQDGAARRAASRAAKWFYEVAWQPQQLAESINAPAAVHGARWLVFAENDGVGAAAAAQLAAGGARCVRVASGAATRQETDGRWTIDPADAAAFADLLHAESAVEPFHAVAYLWPLDAPDDPAQTDSPRARMGAGALHLLQALAALPPQGSKAPRLYLATRGAQPVGGATADPEGAALWGFGRSAANELPGLRGTLIDLDAAYAPDDELASSLVAELLADSAETQVALRGALRHVARLVHPRAAHPHGGKPVHLASAARGKLEALTWEPLTRSEPAPGMVEVAVRATGLNFRDVLNVLGMYPGDPGAPGMECAGYVAAVGDGVNNVAVGDRVLALAGGAFDSHVHAAATLTLPLPDNLTFAEAVTLPSAYLTAAYGLINLAQLQPGERVLIHAAAGGVGIAAVRLAQRMGAEVFATAGSAAKHAFLRSMGVRYIYSSRTLDFAEQILAETGGAGVDVVLNSLADDFIDRSVDVLAPNGRFLEIGKRGIWSPAQFAAVRPQGAYHAYDLTAVLLENPLLIDQMLRELVRDASAGSLKALPLRAFPAGSIVDAFRYMAQARHIGKIVLTHMPTDDGGIPGGDDGVGGIVRPDANYLITGGLGGLGLAIAEGLAARGARHLTLVGRTAPSATAETRLAALRADGVQVQVLAADVGVQSEVERVLAAAAAEQPPLRGIVHAAGVLEDGIVQQQRWERFARVFAPKLDGALHLDALSRTLPIDFFVLFSSAAALMGSPGQSNYAAANAALDALAHRRRAEGLPALSINWGAWSEVGMAARLDAQDQQRTTSKGVGMIPTRDGIAAFDQLLAQEAAQMAVLPMDWTALRSQLGAGSPPPFLAELLDESSAVPVQDGGLLESVHAATTDAERRTALEHYVAAQVVRVLAIDASYTPDPAQPLIEIGMDSLMAVELRNRLESDLHVSLPLASLFDRATMQTLAKEINAQLAAPESAAEQGVANAAVQNPADLLNRLDDLSDADVDALLADLLAQPLPLEGKRDES
jgi:polyketide synthase 12/myxalamid-type polyketide synthase MxaB